MLRGLLRAPPTPATCTPGFQPLAERAPRAPRPAKRIPTLPATCWCLEPLRGLVLHPRGARASCRQGHARPCQFAKLRAKLRPKSPLLESVGARALGVRGGRLCRRTGPSSSRSIPLLQRLAQASSSLARSWPFEAESSSTEVKESLSPLLEAMLPCDRVATPLLHPRGLRSVPPNLCQANPTSLGT